MHKMWSLYHLVLKSKEILAHSPTWMHREHISSCWVEEASHRRTNAMSFHLYEVPRVVKFAETEGKDGGCQGLGSRCWMGTEFQFRKMRSSGGWMGVRERNLSFLMVLVSIVKINKSPKSACDRGRQRRSGRKAVRSKNRQALGLSSEQLQQRG